MPTWRCSRRMTYFFVGVFAFGIQKTQNVRVVGVQVDRPGPLTRAKLVGVGEGIFQHLHHRDLVSCFLLRIEDNMESIGRAVNSALQLSKRGGGVAFLLSNLREAGAPIKRIENQSSGVIPVMKMLEDAFSYGGRAGRPPRPPDARQAGWRRRRHLPASSSPGSRRMTGSQCA